MDGKVQQPKTLQDAIKYFANPDNALAYMVRLRWPDGVVTCPKCGRTDPVFLKQQRKWQCKTTHDHRQFTAKVGTVFEDSPIPLDKWLVAVWMLANCRNGVSSYEVSRTIGVTQKSAWFMMHRIRLAMQSKSSSQVGGLGGEVEIDETFVGGRLKNMHRDRRARLMQAGVGRGGSGAKTAVVGMLDRRQRKIRTTVVRDVKRETLLENILQQVKFGSTIYTDEYLGYDNLPWEYLHEIVSHVDQYVRGRVHTNGLENFWSLLKRGLRGTYVAVEPFHLFRYVDEQAFRYNHRKDGERKITDLERFEAALSQIAGKRLTFAEVTGKVGETIN